MPKKPTDHHDTPLKQIQARVSELEGNWKRALADYRNLEQRFEKERHEFAKFSNTVLIGQLLSVLDDLDRAAAHHPEAAWIGLIKNRLRDILGGEGVQELDSLEKDFDPETMECVETVPGAKHRVIRVVQTGYRLGDRILRPAKVEVGNGEEIKNVK